MKTRDALTGRARREALSCCRFKITQELNLI